jgi:RNA polymerase sigma-70 factor (ECF subfamily)
MIAGGESLVRLQAGASSASPLEDEERRLIAAARAGDHAAFDALVRRHWAKVASVVGRVLNSPNDIEDVTQETFIRAFQSLNSFRGDANLRTWLIRVAVNVCKNRRGGFWFRLVQLAPGDSPALAGVSDALSQAEAGLVRSEQQAVLLAALRRLPDKFRLPIVLHYYEDLSGVEIAAVLGWNESTVWSRIYAGCRALRKTLPTAFAEDRGREPQGPGSQKPRA